MWGMRLKESPAKSNFLQATLISLLLEFQVRETMQKLPIGLQSFKALREDNYLYVDKTFYVKQLADSGKYYFLSRPRRFGKSLFLDTLTTNFSCPYFDYVRL